MSEYGLDISQVLAWTYPQIRLMRINQIEREKAERMWELVLAAGSMNEELFNDLYEGLTGKERSGKMLQSAEQQPKAEMISGSAHGVDADGNVVAHGAPLLSNIALGTERAPNLLAGDMKVIKKDS